MIKSKIKSITINPFMSLIIRAKQLYIALIFGFCMAILEAFGILLLSLLLGSFTQQFDIGNFKLLAFSPFLVEYILELSKSQFQIIICISLVVRYLMSIVFQYTILSLIYNEGFQFQKKYCMDILKNQLWEKLTHKIKENLLGTISRE